MTDPTTGLSLWPSGALRVDCADVEVPGPHKWDPYGPYNKHGYITERDASLQVILESTASKLHDEWKDCMSYMHEKWYEAQTANKSMASMIEQVRDSVLERLNTMTDEFDTTLETYKYRAGESFCWLQSKIEEKLDLLARKNSLRIQNAAWRGGKSRQEARRAWRDDYQVEGIHEVLRSKFAGDTEFNG